MLFFPQFNASQLKTKDKNHNRTFQYVLIEKGNPLSLRWCMLECSYIVTTLSLHLVLTFFKEQIAVSTRRDDANIKFHFRDWDPDMVFLIKVGLDFDKKLTCQVKYI